jgi:hypothetical protein
MGLSGKSIGYRKAGDPHPDMLGSELESFAAAIRDNTVVPISGRDGRAALAVALSVIDESKKAAQALRTHGE